VKTWICTECGNTGKTKGHFYTTAYSDHPDSKGVKVVDCRGCDTHKVPIQVTEDEAKKIIEKAKKRRYEEQKVEDRQTFDYLKNKYGW